MQIILLGKYHWAKSIKNRGMVSWLVSMDQLSATGYFIKGMVRWRVPAKQPANHPHVFYTFCPVIGLVLH